MMNKRRSSGGGKSSLGYLFGSDHDLLGQQQNDQSKVQSSPGCMPPYGTDNNHGQSSLGYLFGSDHDLLGQQQNDQSKVQSSPVCMPPYGTDNNQEKSPEKAPTPPKKDDPGSFKNYFYHGDGDKSTGFLVTGRPSTRVKSVPGGDSSLGYLFGDK